MRVALYARVSTKDKGQDTENQLLQLRQFCHQQGWEIFGEYVDQKTGALLIGKHSSGFSKTLSGVNYFFYLTTIISPYQRQLLFDSSLRARSARFRAGGGALLARRAKIVEALFVLGDRQGCFVRGRPERPTITPSSFRNPFLSP